MENKKNMDKCNRLVFAHLSIVCYRSIWTDPTNTLISAHHGFDRIKHAQQVEIYTNGPSFQNDHQLHSLPKRLSSVWKIWLNQPKCDEKETRGCYDIYDTPGPCLSVCLWLLWQNSILLQTLRYRWRFVSIFAFARTGVIDGAIVPYTTNQVISYLYFNCYFFPFKMNRKKNNKKEERKRIALLPESHRVCARCCCLPVRIIIILFAMPLHTPSFVTQNEY